MVRSPRLRTVQTILLILLVQVGMLTGTWLVLWTLQHHPAGHWSRLPLLIGTAAIPLLALLTSVLIGVRWKRAAEQGLHEVHDRFRHLVDALEGIVWEADAATLGCQFVSLQAERLLGYPTTAWYADPLFWRKHLHPEDREQTIAYFDSAEARLQPFTAEYRMVRVDGSVLWVRDIVSMTILDGRPSVLHGVMVDVTDRHRFQEELERAFQEVQAREADLTSYKDHLEALVMQRSGALLQANTELRVAWEKAEESNRLKSNFLANMSHELRTPLNAIILYSDLIMEEAKAFALNDTQDDLHRIQLAGKHLLSLIEDILDLSRIEAGQATLHLERIDVPDLIQEITFHTVPMLGKNRNRLVIEADPTIQSLLTDQTRLRQILINLLSNAAKFTQDGTITLGAQLGDKPDEVLFYVRDTGIGLTKDQQSRIFQRFTQADDSTTRKFGGTGLGLALSRRLAELLGGSLWVVSEAGAGSTFFVKLVNQLQANQDAPALQGLEI
jgi:PAS domain S-box-containing protein